MRSPYISRKGGAKCLFLPYKGAKIIIFNCNFIQKGVCRQTSMGEFKLENNNFGTFCACSRKPKCFFFSNLFLPH